MTTAMNSLTKLNIRNLSLSAIGGLVGGVPFGMLMAMMGMMPMVGMLATIAGVVYRVIW